MSPPLYAPGTMKRDANRRRSLLRFLVAIVWLAVSAPLAADGLSVNQAWARASPPGVAKAAVYCRITIDDGAPADRLVGVSSPERGEASLHATVSRNGQTRMTPVDGVALPPGTSVAFEPGGRHVMITRLDDRLTAGESLNLVLKLEQRGERELEVPVRPLNAAGP